MNSSNARVCACLTEPKRLPQKRSGDVYLLHESGGDAHRVHVGGLAIVQYGAPAIEESQ